MPSVPKVTMKGSMRPLVINRPWASPNSAPSTSASKAPSVTASSGEPVIGPAQLMNMMTLPAISAAIEPTDRSMPPEMMTKHMPTAMMPMKAVRVSTFIALSSEAKSLLSSAPATHRNTRPTIGPSPCSRGARSRFTGDPWPPTASMPGSGGMPDQFPLAQASRPDHGLHAARAHHRHAVAQAHQLHQLGRDHHDTAPLARQLLNQEVDVAL